MDKNDMDNKLEKFSEAFSFVNDFSLEDKKILSANMVEKTYFPDNFIFDTNSCNGLVFVKKGLLRVYINSEEGKEITLFKLHAGQGCILSYNCTYTDVHYNAKVSALELSEVVHVSNTVLNSFNKKYFSFQKFILETMSFRMNEFIWLIEQVAFAKMDKRIANLLVNKDSKIIYITHDEIAKEIGTAREVVSRMLKHFEKDNLIKLSRSKIYVEDIDKLTKIANS